MLDFLIQYVFLAFIISNNYLGTDFTLPRRDIVILNNGQEIKCKITYIADGLVRYTAESADRTILREINVNASRDIVEAGVFKNTRYSGKLSLFDSESLRIETFHETVKIPKAKVRKIIVSEEPSFGL